MTFAQPFQNYEILDRIGSGSMGTVFKARQKKLNRIVALKVLRPSLARDTRFVDRLGREARIVASLNHPNIVTGYDIDQEGGYHFFVMEFVEGKSLRELLQEWGLFSEDKVLDVAMQAATALDHAYKRGVIHRDIKPGNILIDADGLVKLTDMGLAKGPADLTITREGATVGTPQYISPEQARDPQKVDIRSDLYSLGATLFHMATGQPPFRAETMANLLMKVMHDIAPSAAGINPELSEGLSLVIRKLLAKNPNLRYQTPAELLQDLERVQRQERPDVDLRSLDRAERKRPRVGIAMGIGVSLAALLVVGLMYLFWGEEEDPLTNTGQADKQAAEWHQQLDRELAEAGNWGGQMQVLQLRLAAASGWQLPLLQARQEELQARLGDDLRLFFGDKQRELRGWLAAQADWQNVNRNLSVALEEQVHRKYGIYKSQLPAAVLQAFSQQEQELHQALTTLLRQREESCERMLEDYLRHGRSQWQELLAKSEFRGTLKLMEKSLDEFHPGDGYPQLAQLSEGLRGRLRERLANTRRLATAEIVEAEGSCVARLNQLVTDSQAKVMELAFVDPDRALARWVKISGRWQVDYPPQSFSVQGNPWPVLNSRLQEVRQKLVTQQDIVQGRTRRAMLGIVYQDALQDELGQALQFLESYAKISASAGLQQHGECLSAALQARELLLRKLRDRQGRGKLRVKNRDNDDLQVQIGVGADGKLFIRNEDREPLPLTQLAINHLEGLAGGNDFRKAMQDEDRLGLAMLYLLSGDEGTLASLLPAGSERQFLTAQVIPLVDLLRKDRPDKNVVARKLLNQVVLAQESSRWHESLELLQELEAAHPSFAERQQHILQQMRAKAEAKQRQSLVLQTMRGKARPGVQVELEEDGMISVHYELQQVEMPLRKGWKRQARAAVWEFAQRQVDIVPGLAAEALRFPSLSPGNQQSLAVHINLGFLPEEEAPRLLLLSCHGIHLAMGMVRDGQVAAAVVKRSELLHADNLRRQMRKSLINLGNAQVRVYPNAVHHLLLEIEPSGSRLQLRLWLDPDLETSTVPILTQQVSLPADPDPNLRLMPVQPMVLHDVRFQFRPDV